ncbi:ATP-binding cassette domain-containing protein [Acidimicrobiaceae bacterium USS-CC1]|uniref:ATP-binding cassette domain-containing protein n=1 Tax=Acidiferrimicrobium australe TaxID=2664430 RepID=A0ABW9QQC8_9ACTN|nr:ATP-binding cassette domain-containing protein [Acidiferrimicrobium australe]
MRVLEDVELTLHEGEIVALLGRSGSGKSTLLRTLAGLIAPTSGDVRYRGRPLTGANPGVAMVFQTFALLPWLTVLDNVELGLRAQGVGPDQRRRRALEAIDLIGLDGFESAYPKELSGGMRQRVGFARALVVRPDALFMDEPFSALDVLTAENLRGELLRLWDSGEFPTKAVLIVTHNIEEAVQLADRILVLSSNPGRIKAELTVDLARPRDRDAPAYGRLVDHIYGILTGRDETATVAPAAGRDTSTPLTQPLPDASVGGLAGLLEIVAAGGGRADLPQLADKLSFEVDDLVPLLDAAVMLRFAHVHDADIELTDEGRSFVAGDIDTSKHLFADHARRHAPLVRTITQSLGSTDDGTLRDAFFLDLLRRGFTPDEARHQLDVAIDWGRYAELFDYDTDSGQLHLEQPEAVEAPA